MSETKTSDDKSSEPAPPAEEIPNPGEKEIGGRTGPDPVRYGDWEKGGIAVDF